MDNDNFKHLRPEVNKPSRMLSESPDGKLRGIEPLRASCRWKAPIDDMTTIFTSWSLTNSCNHSLKMATVINIIQYTRSCQRHFFLPNWENISRLFLNFRRYEIFSFWKIRGVFSKFPIYDVHEIFKFDQNYPWFGYTRQIQESAIRWDTGSCQGQCCAPSFGVSQATWDHKKTTPLSKESSDIQPRTTRSSLTLNTHLGSKAMVSKSASSKRS